MRDKQPFLRQMETPQIPTRGETRSLCELWSDWGIWIQIVCPILIQEVNQKAVHLLSGTTTCLSRLNMLNQDVCFQFSLVLYLRSKKIKGLSLKVFGFLKPVLTCGTPGTRLQLHVQVACLELEVFQSVIQCSGNFPTWTRSLGCEPLCTYKLPDKNVSSPNWTDCSLNKATPYLHVCTKVIISSEKEN